MEQKDHQIPLTDMLRAIDCNDKQFYDTLSDAQKKQFSPWLAMRYASNSSKNTEHYLLMVNDLVNNGFMILNKNHPALQWKLLALCGIGKRMPHEFIPPPRMQKGNNKIQNFLSELYPELKSDDLAVIEKVHTLSELKQMFSDAGYNDKEIKQRI